MHRTSQISSMNKRRGRYLSNLIWLNASISLANRVPDYKGDVTGLQRTIEPVGRKG